jgi:hypothetical protein
MQLHERIKEITSKQQLADFVEVLRNDYETNANEWGNNTLAQFLSAMASWIEGMDGYYKSIGEPVPQTPSWRTLADILYASKMYE